MKLRNLITGVREEHFMMHRVSGKAGVGGAAHGLLGAANQAHSISAQ